MPDAEKDAGWLAPQTCVRCGEQTMHDNRVCGRCAESDVGRDAILGAAIKRHDLLYGHDHCDRKYILSCHQLPEIILSLPKPQSETPMPDASKAAPVFGARDEFWTRMDGGQEQRFQVPVEIGEWVQVSYELLAQMLTDLGWTRATSPGGSND